MHFDELSEYSGKAIFLANPFVSIILDEEYNVLDCNQAAIEELGFESKEQLRQSFMAFVGASVPKFQPGDIPSIPFETRVATALEQGGSNFETTLHIQGVERPMKVLMKRIRYLDKLAVAIYQVDLSSVREVERELLRQDRLLQALNSVAMLLMAGDDRDIRRVLWQCLKFLAQSVHADSAWMVKNSPDGTFAQGTVLCVWNKGEEKHRQDAAGHALSYDAVLPGWQALADKGESLNGPLAMLQTPIDLSDDPGVQSVLVLPISLQGVFWGFIGFEDHTARRSFTDIEEGMMRSGGVLIAATVLRAEMMENLMRVTAQAQESDRAKSEFLSRMSHEIRTPMNAIIGMTNIARRLEDVPKIQQCLGKVDTASRQLMNIVNDVLDMSKIEANKLEINRAEFDFEIMIQGVINLVQDRMEEKNQRLHVHFEDVFTRNVISDELRLSQVLINLLNNAVKFTPESGEISLTIRANPTSRDGANLHVEVQDSGIGISAQQQQQLFSAFKQADSSIARRFGGSGLGLAICKKIINLMGGDIWVESEKGKGSTFIFNVEVDWGARQRPTEASAALARDLRVLVIDNDVNALTYFKSLLDSFSLSCDTAYGGVQALQMVDRALAQTLPYNLVFLDWAITDMESIELAREIKRRLQDHTTVIIMPSIDWIDVEPLVAPFGIRHHIAKPILPSVLYNMLVQITRQNQIQPALSGVVAKYEWQAKHILLVEDIEINREIVVTILEETGVAITTAADGAEAVDHFTRRGPQFDLVLMDVQMPVMDGLEATRRIRTSGQFNANDVPIIAMTANAFQEDVAECLAAGMDDHVAKPIDLDNLLGKLALHFKT